MNKNKYISLDLAKKIDKVAEDKRVKLPKSEYYWDAERDILFMMADLMSNIGIPFCTYSAYDTYELGIILPYTIKRDNRIYYLEQKQNYYRSEERISFELYYNSISEIKGKYDNQILDLPIQEKTEVEARGKLLLYLLENNLIKQTN